MSQLRFDIASALLAVLIASGAGLSEASAQQPEQQPELVEEAPAPFNGSFTETSLRGGPWFAGPIDSPGGIADIGFRHSFPMYVFPHRLSFVHGRWSRDNREDTEDRFRFYQLHATVGLHPFYLALLSEGMVSHFLASLHLELGAGARWMISRPTVDERNHSLGVAGSVGVGFDLPVTNPDAGNSLWFNFVARRTWTTNRFDDVDDAARFHDYSLLVGLSWRNNGMLW